MAPGGAAGRPRENAVLAWAVVASQFAPPFMFSGVAVALPSMGAELGAGATALGLSRRCSWLETSAFCCRRPPLWRSAL